LIHYLETQGQTTMIWGQSKNSGAEK
jgi:hypothetical protein